MTSMNVANGNVAHANVRSSDVRGTNVYNSDGEHLGQIDDVVIGKQDGKVKYAIMSFGGFLGIGEEYHPMPWDSLDYSPEMEGFVVELSREQLEGAPRYPVRDEPDWTDEAYGRRVYEYYGVPYAW